MSQCQGVRIADVQEGWYLGVDDSSKLAVQGLGWAPLRGHKCTFLSLDLSLM